MLKFLILIVFSFSAEAKINFSDLYNSTGKKITSAEVNSEIKIASFFFSSCAHTCLLINNKLKSLHKKIKKSKKQKPQIQILSITVDPKYDTVKRLETYSKKWRPTNESWKFITGSPTEVFRVIKDEFKLEGGGTAFVHSESVIIYNNGVKGKSYSLFNKKEYQNLLTDLQLK